ncbi:myb family transcription factor EFM-like isoform X2 [Abrus precatorius]|uniref:Myb family transcription factor EFM-like isoform X2 n=1 Tax=Abrus precatorius TaxID=3816 RepID=A0A8B8KPF6_ABRPR|nr:myb family transcription factor EFM-like isoform X2 [Abrus precatorius]
MGSVPSELTLDLRPTFVPKTITDFLCHLSSAPDKLPRLHDFLARLEDELRKIHAFKRELPLSMLLLNDAISVVREESEKCRARNSVPVLEEFIPLKKERDENEDNDNKDTECRDKKNWMSSVQLWNNTATCNNDASDHKQHRKLEIKKSEEEGQSVGEDPFQSCSYRNGGGRGFMPFSAYTCSSSSSVPVRTVALGNKEEKEDSVVNRLSLLSPPVKSFKEGCGSRGSRSSSSNRAVSSSPPTVQPSLRAAPLQHQQTARKQRRCWSPELHRRFVNALQKLGGSQATPKQIRELMQVDGLTNDEVKSHLQKYRLHTRRVPTASGNQPVVVLGSLWMSQDQYNDSSKVSSSGSGSPQSPLHLGAGCRGGTSPTEGDSMEDDEDAKSESYSWKSQLHKAAKVDV